ncbi:hypothetical protein OGATHE_000117 [Ogataea polymorpha]|uniref:Uncharacterized protein n=1 Tax=Ogataea polymorpha TaxID=460523 RepID=A0A9P8PUZ6_9ASCO|nr:hypothetical protein OGATHE_000117 [Ogataea polymorpha]
MLVSFKNLLQFPIIVPIPKLDSVIVRRSQNVRSSGVDCNGPNVVRMSFKLSNAFTSIIVVNSNLKIVRTNDNPIFAGDEFPCSNRDIGNINCFDD